MTNLEVGDIVMCTVERIVGTSVFVKIKGDGEGTIILSEIAPGRIRNLREYVVPKKKIICKVLRIGTGMTELSLRRVTKKEQKEVLEQEKLEKSYINILKTILKEKAQEIIEKIEQEQEVYEFIEEAKNNPEKLEKLIGKEDAKKVLEIIKSQKQKEVFLKKEFFLTSLKENGIAIIKKILGEVKNTEIKYLSAGKYMIKASAENLKEADKKIKEDLEKIEKLSKKQGAEFKIKC